MSGLIKSGTYGLMGAAGVGYISASLVSSNTASYVASASKTWTGMNLGIAESDRRIILAATHVDIIGTYNGGGAISSATIAGISMTKLTNYSYNRGSSYALHTDFWYADVPTGTSGSLVVNYTSGNYNEIRVALYKVRGASMTLYDTATQNRADSGVLSQTINVAENGLLIAAACGTDDNPDTRMGSHAFKNYTNAVVNQTVSATRSGTGVTWAGVNKVYEVNAASNSVDSHHFGVISLKPDGTLTSAP